MSGSSNRIDTRTELGGPARLGSPVLTDPDTCWAECDGPETMLLWLIFDRFEAGSDELAIDRSARGRHFAVTVVARGTRGALFSFSESALALLRVAPC